MKPPIINCHTHVFTGDMVPDFLAKKFLIWPLYYLLPVSLIVRICRYWYREPGRWKHLPRYKNAARFLYRITMALKRSFVLLVIERALEIFLMLQAFFILYDCLKAVDNAAEAQWAERLRETLSNWVPVSWPLQNPGLQVLIVMIVILFIPFARNLVFLALKQIFKFLGKVPGKDAKALAKRYMNIGRYAFNTQQDDIFARLKKQYPEDTGFVLLPMDMEYMAAGRLKKEHRYRTQIEQLATIKKNHPETAFPFLFVDPRRIGKVEKEINYIPGDKPYFIYDTDQNGHVILGDCFVKDHIEANNFSGFKIYPALGYYPFDYRLLPLWKYAADKGLPILTHCIRGTIFYRGSKKKEWDYHRIIKESCGNDNYRELLLSQKKNIDFSVNFTHPLNYLCLLDEKLLRKAVEEAMKHDAGIGRLFGYTNDTTPLKTNLNHLKLCFGHFGGDDEWLKYFELDRYSYANQLTQKPNKGIDFSLRTDGKPSPGKLEQLWKFNDWYSIICSIMLQYPNVYADISYILHDCDGTLPLLKQTLQNPDLKDRVLYGTDFYVVRNHKSDKNMLADMRGGLSEDEFDLIARYNPQQFLAHN